MVANVTASANEMSSDNDNSGRSGSSIIHPDDVNNNINNPPNQLEEEIKMEQEAGGTDSSKSSNNTNYNEKENEQVEYVDKEPVVVVMNHNDSIQSEQKAGRNLLSSFLLSSSPPPPPTTTTTATAVTAVTTTTSKATTSASTEINRNTSSPLVLKTEKDEKSVKVSSSTTIAAATTTTPEANYCCRKRRRFITPIIYDEIVQWCQNEIHNGEEFMFNRKLFEKSLQEVIETKTFKEGDEDEHGSSNANEENIIYFEYESLLSLFRNIHLQYVKKSGSWNAKKKLNGVIQQYVNDHSTSILELAKQINYPPYLLCRLIVERLTTIGSSNNSHNSSKNNTTQNGGHDHRRNIINGKQPASFSAAAAAAATTTTATKSETTTSGGSKQQQQQQQQQPNTSKPLKPTKNKTTLIMAMRDPIKILGDMSILRPEYLISEPSNNTNQRRQQHQQQQQQLHSTANSKSDTTSTTRLAQTVKDAIDNDPMYGPKHDHDRHFIGIEYEVLLESKLKEIGIPFITETKLRELGSSKTPDILLECPIGVPISRRKTPNAKTNYNDEDENGDIEWKVICWIDSKGLFGDVFTHTTNVLPQVESYVHRFGPGLILYWFGHAPLSELNTAKGDVVIVGWDIPQTFMWPTGDIQYVTENEMK